MLQSIINYGFLYVIGAGFIYCVVMTIVNVARNK